MVLTYSKGVAESPSAVIDGESAFWSQTRYTFVTL